MRVLAAAGVLAVAGFVALPAGSAVAADCGSTTGGRPDFDGSGGARPDMAIGVPGEDRGSAQNAGVVEVRLASGTVKGLTAPDGQAGDRFGVSVTVVNLNSDGCADLLIGAPGRDVGNKADAGAVYLFVGTPDVPQYQSRLTMASPGFPGVQAGARFGNVIDAYAPAGSPWLAGLPRYDVGGKQDAGAVMEFGKTWAGVYTQDSPEFVGAAEAGDQFGGAVYAQYFEGDDRSFFTSAPREDFGGHTDAGVAYLCAESTTTAPACQVTIEQGSGDIPAAPEDGDRFGEVLVSTPSGLYFGVPHEDVSGKTDAGVLCLHTDRWRCVSQDTPGFPGAVETGDQFGASVADYHPVWPTEAEDPFQVIMVGVPGEDLGSARDAGSLNTILDYYKRTSDERLDGAQGLTANVTGGQAEPGDRYGETIVSSEIVQEHQVRHLSLWTIGSPGDRSGAGQVFQAETGEFEYGLTASRAWRQQAGAPETGDEYGFSLVGQPRF